MEVEEEDGFVGAAAWGASDISMSSSCFTAGAALEIDAERDMFDLEDFLLFLCWCLSAAAAAAPFFELPAFEAVAAAVDAAAAEVAALGLDFSCARRASKSSRWFANVFWDCRILRTLGVCFFTPALLLLLFATMGMLTSRW